VRDRWRVAALAVALASLSFLRPVDHDESQYVAAAVLSAHGLLPYRDYAYLQTPLQPFLFAPVAWAAGDWAWPVLRLVNALLGTVAVVATVAAARAAGASARMAWIAGALFATCDILLFSIGTARNDALPAACLSVALWLAVLNESGATRGRAAAIGLLLAAAAAAKISYALPAATYGVLALLNAKRRRPFWVAIGALPILAFVGWTLALSPLGFFFGAIGFPATAPADWYAARPWKLSGAGKALDLLKFLALGPALIAIAALSARRDRRPVLLHWLLIAGLVAALLPTPTWRQYLLPLLPPLFVLLALRWTAAPPSRCWRIATAVFVGAGIAPSVAALAQGNAMPTAMVQARAIRTALDRERIDAPVASLSPQFVTLAGRLPDPRFATGPFVFRGRAIVSRGQENLLTVIPRRRLDLLRRDPPAALLTGGEAWTAGDARLDALLDRWAAANGYRATAAGRFTLWVPITRS
jgi:hypothetical protein